MPTKRFKLHDEELGTEEIMGITGLFYVTDLTDEEVEKIMDLKVGEWARLDIHLVVTRVRN